MLEPAAVEKYLQGRHSYLTKHLTLARNNGMNVCSRCETKFYITGNPDDACYGKYKHIESYDFSLNEDVTLCRID